MVAASQDLESAVNAPVVVPGVGDQPVGRSFLHTPAHDPDGMAAESRPLDMLIDSGLVVDEVGEDGEGCLRRAVGHQLVHDLLLVAGNVVGLLAVCQVLLVGDLVVGVLAFPVALGGPAASLARSTGSIDMVLARLDLVRLAAVIGSEVATGDQALLGPIAPGHTGEPSVAAEAASVAAAQEVLSRDVVLELAVAVDAQPVRH